jgi:hypothetical protein
MLLRLVLIRNATNVSRKQDNLQASLHEVVLTHAQGNAAVSAGRKKGEEGETRVLTHARGNAAASADRKKGEEGETRVLTHAQGNAEAIADRKEEEGEVY